VAVPLNSLERSPGPSSNTGRPPRIPGLRMLGGRRSWTSRFTPRTAGIDYHREVIQTPIFGKRLILRRWRQSDRDPFARINADPRVMEFFPALLSHKESDSMVDRIEAHFDAHGFGLWAAELRQDGTFVGFVGLNIPSFPAPFTPCLEIGWRLAAEYWGRGLATEAAHAVLERGFRGLGVDEIVAFTVPGNARSRRVMDKLGMSHTPADDFDHPRLPEGHPLRRHVLYRLRRSNWSGFAKLTLDLHS
jgi:RimJ/RimL family protein N-acetyltransferase